MVLQAASRISCFCFLLFNIAAGYPPQKSPPGGAGFSRGGSGFLGGSGLSFSSGPGFLDSGAGSSGSGFLTAGSGSLSSGQQGLGIGDVFAEIESLRPNRLIPQFAWTSDHVAKGTFAEEPVYASSHVVHYNSGYERQRDSRTDSKYVKDTFGHIPLPETQEDYSKTGPKGQKLYY